LYKPEQRNESNPAWLDNVDESIVQNGYDIIKAYEKKYAEEDRKFKWLI